jgi:TonB family protein
VLLAASAHAAAPLPSPMPIGTRATPFAVYVTSMHRQIHLRWMAFLAGLDAHAPTAFKDDPALWAQLEIVVRGDGALDRITMVRASGVRAFDDAALDAVTRAAPFPPPPPPIESADGKVHLRWRLYRDAVRGCSTIGVDPLMLGTAPSPKPSSSDARGNGSPAPRVPSTR